MDTFKLLKHSHVATYPHSYIAACPQSHIATQPQREVASGRLHKVGRPAAASPLWDPLWLCLASLCGCVAMWLSCTLCESFGRWAPFKVAVPYSIRQHFWIYIRSAMGLQEVAAKTCASNPLPSASCTSRIAFKIKSSLKLPSDVENGRRKPARRSRARRIHKLNSRTHDGSQTEYLARVSREFSPVREAAVGFYLREKI